jgi:ABC-type transport system involved in cytochrome c biogenesis permease subunit
MFKQLKQSPVVRFLASPKLTVICLLALIILTIWGTIYQADHGLFQAKKRFFQSWFLLLNGILPFPGTVLVFWVMFINLLFSLLFRIGFKLANIGNILTHLGVLIMLVGGFFTFQYAFESNLTLRENEGSNFSKAYHQWELSLWKVRNNTKEISALDTDDLSQGEELAIEELEIRVKEYYTNCQAKLADRMESKQALINSSGIGILKNVEEQNEPARNVAGIVFAIKHKGEKDYRNILLYGRDPKPTSLTLGNETYHFKLQRKRYLLPFYIKLIDFKKILYPGSDIVKSYESHVEIQTNGLSREVVISMNKPLRYKDYSIFQSSYYIGQDGRENSTFSVVKNWGRLFPYISSILIFIGLAIHFLVMVFKRKTTPKRIKMKGKNKGLLLILILVLGLQGMAFDNEKANSNSLSLESFKKIVILENGRKKPFDTYAQNTLKQFSGRSKFEGKPAIHWFARILFDPQATHEDKVFLITNSEVLNSLGVTPTNTGRERYSFSQFMPHLQKLRELAISVSKLEKEEKTTVENEILLLYNKLYRYRELMASFQFVIPQEQYSITDEGIKKYLRLASHKSQFSFFDLAEKSSQLKEMVQIIKEKNQEEWSPGEERLVLLADGLNHLANFNRNLPLNILPVIKDDEEKWINPWDLISSCYLHHHSIPQELFLIRDMVGAFHNNNQATFDSAIRSFNDLIIKESKGKVSAKKISAEILYNSINPFIRSQFFYGFSLLVLIFSFIVKKREWLYKFSFALVCAGILIHTSGVILRMIIRGRPPVTNLYETFVFTALITILLGITLEFFKKKNIGLLTGSISAIILLLISNKYALEGDTMGMLMAVLNTNFWLAVHIITITVGFAGIVISGIIGHVYIFQKILKPGKSDLLKNTYQAIYSTQAFGLVFTFIGTVLGGMWADQSWGRFWGWDPKENGALVIILWSALIFHARLAKWIKELGFALGSIGGIITVVLTWFGINLLGVGLHSYGFTSKLAITLAIFLLLEIIFMLTSYLYITLKNN